jgi:hypothetical protein
MRNLLITRRHSGFRCQRRGSLSPLCFVSSSEQDAEDSQDDVEEDVEAKVSSESFSVSWCIFCLENLITRQQLA